MAEIPINSPLWDANKPIMSMPSSEAYREKYDKIQNSSVCGNSTEHREKLCNCDASVWVTQRGVRVKMCRDCAAEWLPQCTPCGGKGYHVEREEEDNGYGGTKMMSHRVPCACCDGTGKRKEP